MIIWGIKLDVVVFGYFINSIVFGGYECMYGISMVVFYVVGVCVFIL